MKESTTRNEILAYFISLLVLLVGLEKAEAAPLPLSVPSVYPTIQSAIDASVDGDEIVVAPGTYNEAIDFSGKAIRLHSSGGPAITTIDANDATEVDSSAVTCINSEGPDTILEGFTITGGNKPHGGGMFNSSSNPTVINCTFSGNEAYLGGGMYNSYSNPTVTNCTFRGNTAGNYGGGMYNSYSSPNVSNCIFSANTAQNNDGGGMYNISSSSPNVTNCTFSGNIAKFSGGGMYNGYSSNPNVTNCTFSGNKATFSGGGMYNISSSPTITNCAFRTNTSGSNGGGMYNLSSSNPNVTNCTFSGNKATSSGGGMYNLASSPTVTNCILWDNSPGEYLGSATINYSDVQGGYTGIGNINIDPLFADADNGDFHLLQNSPCIDTGNNDAVPSGVTTDLDGNPRISGDYVDMGAYERTDELTDPFQLVLLLIQDVVAVHIQQGIANSLDAKLNAVTKALEDINENNDAAAVNALEAFINSVEAQSGNKIAEEDAAHLIDSAQSIINILVNGI